MDWSGDASASDRRTGTQATPAFRILGPMEVAGGRLALDAPRQRVVLAMLLVEANKVVPLDRLADAVWDDGPPATARSQVQICISILRRELARAGMPDMIVTRAPGYQLRVDDDDLDLLLFDRHTVEARRAVAEQRHSDAAAALRAALRYWSGEPLAGIDSRLVRTAATKIAERLLAACEDRIELDLQLGAHHDVVGDLLTLVAEHPLRERLRALLMIALYRAGRQPEALAVYRQAREEFAEELGIEPSVELRNLERAILTGDPELGGSPGSAGVLAATRPEPAGLVTVAGGVRPILSGTVPQLLPADVADFTGRHRLVAELIDLLGAPAEANAMTLVAIAGRGGVGKTGLALHVAHRLRASFPDGQLYAHLRGTEARPPNVGQTLERFLRALGYAGTALPEGHDERAEMYRDALAGRRVLVVLDDAHDERQVAPLLPGSGTCAVVVTSRLRLSGLANAHQRDLDTLTSDEALALVARIIGPERARAEPGEAVDLVNLCGHLPLALRIGSARLAARPHWTIARLTTRLADEQRRLDELVHHGHGVRSSISIAYEGLEPEAQRLFRSLGAIEAPDFPSWVAAALLTTDLADAEDHLEALVDVRLLDAEQVAGTARYRFHDLIRLYARERLAAESTPTQRRDGLARLAGAWLVLAREAHRRHYGGDFTILRQVDLPADLPALPVEDLLAQPLQWLDNERTGLVATARQAAEASLDELACDLAITAVTLFEAHSYHDDWRATHEAALLASQRAGNRRGEAAMLYSLGALGAVEHRFAEAERRLTAALSLFIALDDQHGQALTLRHLAFIDRVSGDAEAAMGRYEQALAGLRAVGDLIGEAHVLGGMTHVHLERGDIAGAMRLLERALALAREVGNRRVEAQLIHRLGETHLTGGDLDAAEEMFRAVLELAVGSGDMVGECHARMGLGMVAARRERHDDAAQSLGTALALAERTGQQMVRARVSIELGELHFAAGRYRDSESLFAAAAELFERLGAKRLYAQARDRLDQCANLAPLGSNELRSSSYRR
jgi:DNA-binding SARP family transcriptional activator/tetratricopeptide (TPR) repeat protein